MHVNREGANIGPTDKLNALGLLQAVIFGNA